jgi:hypothetical protein
MSNRTNILNKLETYKELTPDGKNWLIQALDPFHDVEHPLRGYPDEDGAKTLIQRVNKTFSVTAPGVGPWDCHIATLPTLESGMFPAWTTPVGPVQAQSTGYYNRGIGGFGTYADNFRYAPVVINSVDAGLPTYPNSLTPMVVPDQHFVTFDEFLVGATRVVAAGFEVHNTTPDLYKSGSVVVYRMPQETQIAAPWSNQTFDSGGSHYNSFITNTAYVSAMPPAFATDALVYAGSKQWEAAEGCYVVETMSTTKNPLAVRLNAQRLFVDGPLTAVTPMFGSFGGPLYNTVGDTILGISANQYNPIQPSPYNTSGAYFTGLTPQSVLTVTVTYYFEMAPYDNTLLETMAQPSAAFDPLALEIYSHITASLPAGAKVCDNASGDFFRSILTMISDIAPIAGLIAAPFVGAAGPAIGGILSKGASQISKLIPADKPKKKSHVIVNAKPFIPKDESVLVRR